MSTIGLGDFYPNVSPTDYATTGSIQHHPVYGYTLWARALVMAALIFAFGLNTIMEYTQQRRELAVLNARAQALNL